MAKLSTLIVPAALAALATTAVPAMAAPYSHREGPDRSWQQRTDVRGPQYTGFKTATNLRRDIARLDAQIDRAMARSQISPREAVGLHRDVSQLDRLYASYARSGLTRWEARTLEARIARVYRDVRVAMTDRNRRHG